MTVSSKILMSKPMLSRDTGRRIFLSDMPHFPMSANSFVRRSSDVEQDVEKKATSSHFIASEESMNFLDKSTTSPAWANMAQTKELTQQSQNFLS